MGSDESHFNVSVGSDGQSHRTVSTNHNHFEEKGEPKRYQAWSNMCHTNTLSHALFFFNTATSHGWFQSHCPLAQCSQTPCRCWCVCFIHSYIAYDYMIPCVVYESFSFATALLPISSLPPPPPPPPSPPQLNFHPLNHLSICWFHPPPPPPPPFFFFLFFSFSKSSDIHSLLHYFYLSWPCVLVASPAVLRTWRAISAPPHSLCASQVPRALGRVLSPPSSPPRFPPPPPPSFPTTTAMPASNVLPVMPSPPPPLPPPLAPRGGYLSSDTQGMTESQHWEWTTEWKCEK